jgi:hypothetical protein
MVSQNDGVTTSWRHNVTWRVTSKYGGSVCCPTTDWQTTDVQATYKVHKKMKKVWRLQSFSENYIFQFLFQSLTISIITNSFAIQVAKINCSYVPISPSVSHYRAVFCTNNFYFNSIWQSSSNMGYLVIPNYIEL